MNAGKRWVTVAAAAMLAGAACAAECCAKGGAAASKETAATKAQTTCPIMGGAVDKSKFVDYDGKRIYVCCAGCIATVKKDPAKYVKQLEAAGVTLDKATPAKK